jgi:3-hydroxymyristoyl/3-hydroxydecanoyl-(acyl carrier protein) dehydratase
VSSDPAPRQVVENDDGSVACVFLPGPDYAGFDGHFPGDPVLPGMCHLDLALQALRIATGNPCEVAGVVRARFRRIVRPGEELRIVVRRVPDASHPGRWRCEHFVGEEPAAEIVVDLTGG